MNMLARLVACSLFASATALFSGWAQSQSVPSSCDGINYDCMAMGTTPWEYHHNTCFVQETRATEAESLQDSGKDKCQDNADCITKENEGPLPPGDYRIHKAGYSPNRPKWLYLQPSPTNTMHDRSEFFIHGWGVSNGCIAIYFNSDFSKLSQWATQDNGGTLRVSK